MILNDCPALPWITKFSFHRNISCFMRSETLARSQNYLPSLVWLLRAKISSVNFYRVLSTDSPFLNPSLLPWGGVCDIEEMELLSVEAVTLIFMTASTQPGITYWKVTFRLVKRWRQHVWNRSSVFQGLPNHNLTMEIILLQDQGIQLLLPSAPASATKVQEVFSICNVLHHLYIE
jgi:hypothetical protein